MAEEKEKEEHINSSHVTEEEEEEGEESSDKRAKRARPGDSSTVNDLDSGDAPSPKRRAKSHDVLFRIVVPSKQVGKVIGKEGSRIRTIREGTKAIIKIADAVSRHEERVIIISSKDDDSKISDAEKALYVIARLILQENDSSIEQPKASPGNVVINIIRLLIAGSQAGFLIGKSGQNIEKIRSSSGATIMILPQNQLPLCASAHEYDRLVQISGDVPEVLKALETIGSQLRENPPSKVISIRPMYSSNSSGHSFLAPTSGYLTLNTNLAADYVTSEMTISESLVGGLIGKCGYNISRIRNLSGAMIKVTGGKGEQDQRQIHFGGSAQQVALATKLVNEYLCSQSL